MYTQVKSFKRCSWMSKQIILLSKAVQQQDIRNWFSSKKKFFLIKTFTLIFIKKNILKVNCRALSTLNEIIQERNVGFFFRKTECLLRLVLHLVSKKCFPALKMTRRQHDVCRFLLFQQFGEQVSVVGKYLLQKSPSPLHLISSETHLDTEQVNIKDKKEYCTTE